MSTAHPSTVRVRVKSRTGDAFVRAGRLFRADAWTAVEVPLDVALVLHDDPWLDVRDLAPDAPVDAGPGADAGSLERQLAEAHARIVALEARLREVELQRDRELDQLRETHARELSAANAAGRKAKQQATSSGDIVT
jgi:hypothetical protein